MLFTRKQWQLVWTNLIKCLILSKDWNHLCFLDYFLTVNVEELMSKALGNIDEFMFHGYGERPETTTIGCYHTWINCLQFSRVCGDFILSTRDWSWFGCIRDKLNCYIPKWMGNICICSHIWSCYAVPVVLMPSLHHKGLPDIYEVFSCDDLNS